jgi:hypothetical protein
VEPASSPLGDVHNFAILFPHSARSLLLPSMQECLMKTFRVILAACAACIVLVAQAQTPAPPGPPSPAQIVSLLNLDAQRAQVVTAILENGHQQMQALRQQGQPTDDASRAAMRASMQAVRADVDKQLAGVLTADELAKLRQSMPRPQRRQPM